MGETKHKKQALATKKRIRNTALQLMRKHSIDEVSVNDICEKAKVGVGTFYYYYKAKNDILLEVFEEADAIFVKLNKCESLKTISPYDYIIQHCLCYAEFITETGVEFTKKLYSIQSKVFIDKDRAIYSTLRTFLEQKQKSNLIDPSFDVQEFCHTTIACVRGIVYDWCLHEGSYDLVKATNAFAEIYLEKYKPLLSFKAEPMSFAL